MSRIRNQPSKMSQCYDKFRKLKQSLRKYEDEKKTGNGTPKPIKFTIFMTLLGMTLPFNPFIFVLQTRATPFKPVQQAQPVVTMKHRMSYQNQRESAGKKQGQDHLW